MDSLPLRVGFSPYSQIQLREVARSLLPYLQYLSEKVKSGGEDYEEASLHLLDDKDGIGEILELARKFSSRKLKYVVVVGIGGSSLETHALYDAVLRHRQRRSDAQLLIADTVSPPLLQHIAAIIRSEIHDSSEIIINLVSKSGTTTETIANFEYLFGVLKKTIHGAASRVVVTSDKGSPLWQKATVLNFPCLRIPSRVGGRYSGLSAVGLFPLALLGADMKNLISGARIMREHCLQEEVKQNPALLSATLGFLARKDGIVLQNHFYFHPELEALGKWQRMLFAESLGKATDRDGKEFTLDITPLVSIGSTDLHSMGQLYFAWPQKVFTTFVFSPKQQRMLNVPSLGLLNTLVDGISGRTIGDIMSAIYTGVTRAYKKNKMPFVEIELPEISEYSLGGLMQMKMIETMFLGKLLNLNPFDQPNVEAYKKESRKILERS